MNDAKILGVMLIVGVLGVPFLVVELSKHGPEEFNRPTVIARWQDKNDPRVTHSITESNPTWFLLGLGLAAAMVGVGVWLLHYEEPPSGRSER